MAKRKVQEFLDEFPKNRNIFAKVLPEHESWEKRAETALALFSHPGIPLKNPRDS